MKSNLDSDPDFVELRNLGKSQVDLSGWELRDDDENKFIFQKPLNPLSIGRMKFAVYRYWVKLARN